MALIEIGASHVQFDHPAGLIGTEDDEDVFLLDGLFSAVGEGDVQKVQDALLTLPSTVDLNQRSGSGETAVHAAVRTGSIAVLEALAQRGADLHQLNNNCENGLHMACQLASLSVANFLIDHAICLDGQTRNGDSPIHLAAKCGNFEIMQLLCSRGANLNAQDRNLHTPLHIVAALGNFDCVRLLVLAGARTNMEDRDGWTPLQHAIKAGQVTIALTLINSGAAIDQLDQNRECPLHVACRVGILAVVQALCAFGCRVDVYNAQGFTPLHIASRAGHLEIARCLLLAGANPHLASREGVLPEVMALAQGHTPTASLLGKMRPERRAVCVEQLVPTQRPLPRIKLKVFGHSTSGKTSLIDSLRSNLITGFFRKKFKSADDNSSDEESQYFSMRLRTMPSELNFEVHHEGYTRGINVQNQNITGAGDFSVWEFSGYEPYYIFYDHFIGDTSCIHLVLFNLMDSFDLMRQKALFWVNFVMSRIPAREPLGYCGKPRVMARLVLVGTHADKSAGLRNEKGLLQNHDAERILEEVILLTQYRLEVCDEVFIVDSNEAMSPEMKALRQKLSDWRTIILKHLPNSNGFLDVVASKIPEWATTTQFPVYTWHQFVENVRNRVNPLCSEDHLKDLIQELQYIGEVIYLESDLEQDMIVLSPQWLCGGILGYLLSYDNIAQARVTGSFTVDDIQFMIAEAEASQLLRVLVALDLCTPVELEDETQYEFPSLNFLESLRGLWEKEIRHDNSVYAGVQFRAAKSQLVHIFPRIQCCIRRNLRFGKDGAGLGVIGQADLFQWFHGSKLTLNCIECMIRMEDCEQVIRLRARGPPDQMAVLFGIYQDLFNLIEQTIDEMCPSLEFEVALLSPRELKKHSKLIIPVPQGAIFSAMMEQLPPGSDSGCDENSRLISFPSPSISVNYEDGLVQEDLENLLCFGSQQLLAQLRLGPQLPLTSIRTQTFQHLCSLFDPPDPMGKDWCLLAVKLGMTQSVPSIDNTNEWLRSRTAKVLEEWAKTPSSSVGSLVELLKEIGREDASSLLMNAAPLYAYTAQRQAENGEENATSSN